MKYFYIFSLLLMGAATRAMETPLMEAIKNKDLPKVTELLEEKADPNQRDGLGFHPLSYASFKDIAFTEVLLKYGANPNAETDPSIINYTVFNRVLVGFRFNKTERVALMLRYGANPFQLDDADLIGHLKKEHQENKEIWALLKAARKKRYTTFLLCLKEKYPQIMITEILERIVKFAKKECFHPNKEIAMKKALLRPRNRSEFYIPPLF